MANLQTLNQQKKQFYTMHSPINVHKTFIRIQQGLNQYYNGLPILRLLVTHSCTTTAVPKNNEQI